MGSNHRTQEASESSPQGVGGQPGPLPPLAVDSGPDPPCTRIGAFCDASGFKRFKCLKPDDAFSFDSASGAWSTITNADAATVAAEITANLAKYDNCTVRVEEE